MPVYLVHMHSAGRIFSLRFPVGTTASYVQTWLDSRAQAFQVLQITHVEVQEV